MTKRFVAKYSVKGQILNHDQTKFYIEVLDDDQHWFDDRIDDLLGSSWTDDSGNFEVIFEDELFKENWFEGKPEIFLIVRDKLGKVLHKTTPKNPSGPDDAENLTFEIVIPEEDYFTDSPYDSANTRRMAAFMRIGDSIDLGSNLTNSSQLLIQSLNAWLLYTNETKWKIIGYDGPQVERCPWRTSHNHKLKWNNN